jgi:hypothetical protein
MVYMAPRTHLFLKFSLLTLVLKFSWLGTGRFFCFNSTVSYTYSTVQMLFVLFVNVPTLNKTFDLIWFEQLIQQCGMVYMAPRTHLFLKFSLLTLVLKFSWLGYHNKKVIRRFVCTRQLVNVSTKPVIEEFIWHHKYATTCIWTCRNNSEIFMSF